MPGKLLIVTGLSGSGKSTLVEAVLQSLPHMSYLKTYTTRPRRSGEENSHEFEFVSEDEYITLRSMSNSWNHSEYAGYSYGTDISSTLANIQQGEHVICAVAPSLKIIAQVKALHNVDSLILLVNTPKLVAESRIADDKLRSLRRENLDYITADYIFTPTQNIFEDKQQFIAFIQKIIDNNFPKT